DGVGDVGRGEEAAPGGLGVGAHGGTHPPGRHEARGLSEGMRGADRHDQLGHPVAYLHLASLPELAVVGDAWPLPAPPGAKRLCLCDTPLTAWVMPARRATPAGGFRPSRPLATWEFGAI